MKPLRVTIRVPVEIDMEDLLDGVRLVKSQAKINAAVRAFLLDYMKERPVILTDFDLLSDLAHMLMEGDLVTTDEDMDQ